MDWFNPSITKKELGLKLDITETKFGRIVYEVIDERLFFLAIIKYGIEFTEVKCSM
jgi:hypothetical protein